MKLMCLSAISVVRRAAHPFPTHRRNWRADSRDHSKVICAGFTEHFSSNLGVGAVGGFSLHALSVFFLPVFVSPNHP